MRSFIHALSSNPLIFYALIAVLSSSIVSGIIGSYVVVKRISFIGGAISHSLFAGIGLFLWLERVHNMPVTPLQGALVAALLSALCIGFSHIYFRQREDSIISSIWSIGMAIGLLFISQTPGFTGELSNFLIGNLLWVSYEDLWLVNILNVFVTVSAFLLHERFVAISFDENQAIVQGIRVRALSIFLLMLVASTIVLLMQVVGILLVMTMLTLPAACASLFTRKLSHMIGVSIFINAFSCVSGLFVSFEYDLPPGATIALILGSIYAFALSLKKK